PGVRHELWLRHEPDGTGHPAERSGPIARRCRVPFAGLPHERGRRVGEVVAPPSVSVMLRSWDIRVGTTGEMVLDAARRAEDAGLDGIIAGDHVTFYGYGNDGLITLTAVAAVTERI